MSKPIKILSIIAVILSGFAFLLSVAILTFLWEPMGYIYTSSTEILEDGPIIPIANILSISKIFVIALFLLLTSKSKRFIAIEIIAIVLLIGFPFLAQFLELIQLSWVNPMGSNAVARYAVTKNVLTLPGFIMGLSSTLCLVLCGMRISLKSSLKAQQSI